MTDNKINQYAAFISSQIDKNDIKEAVEQVDEAIKLGTPVIIHNPGNKNHGKKGTVGEIRRGLPGVIPKYYTVDHDGTSSLLPKENLRIVKGEVEQVDEAIKSAFKRRDKVTIYAPGNPHHGEEGYVSEIHPGIPGSKNRYYTVYHGNRSSLLPKENLRIVKREMDQIDELSRGTMASYVKKASVDAANKMSSAGVDYARSADIRDTDKNKSKELDKEAGKSYTKSMNRLSGIATASKKLAKEDVEQIDELSRDTVRGYIRKAIPDNKEREAKVMKPFPLKDMDKNVAMHKKMQKRNASIELAGKKAYSIGGDAKVNATEEVKFSDEELEAIENIINDRMK